MATYTWRRLPAWLAITFALLRCWRRIASNAVGGSQPLLAGAAALAVLLAAGWSLMLVTIYRQILANQPDLDPAALATMQRAITGSNTLSTFAIGAATMLAIIALSPSQTAIHALIATRPVRPRTHLLGQSLPLLGASVLATGVLSGPTIAVYLTGANRDGRMPAALEAAGLVLGLLAVDVAVLVAIHAATAVCVMLGIGSDGLRRMFGLFGGAVLMIGVFGHDFVALFQPGAATILTQPADLYHRLDGGPVAGAAMLAVPLLVLAACCAALAWLTNFSMRPTTRGVPTIASRPYMNGSPRFMVVTMAEMRVLLRHPVMLAGSILGLAMAAGTRVLMETLDPEQRQPILMIAPMIMVTLSGLVAEGAYGRTRPWHGLYRHQPQPNQVWFWPKITANLIYALALAAISLLLLAAFSATPISSFGLELFWFALLFPTAFLAGVLLPYRDDVPFSAALTSALALTLSIVTFIGLAKISDYSNAATQLTIGAAVAVACIFFARLSSR